MNHFVGFRPNHQKTSSPVIKKIEKFGFTATGGFSSGSIMFIDHPKLLQDDQKCRAIVEPDPRLQFSKLSQGARGSLLARGRTKDGKISEWAIALSFLVLPEKPEYLRETILECSGWAKHVRIMNRLKDEMEIPHESFETEFKKFIGDRIIRMIENGGSGALRDLGHLLKLVESKSEFFPQVPLGEGCTLTFEEQEFCHVLANETCKVADVPTQKHVREAWIALRNGRNEDQFKRVRDRLGFKWLPKSQRGKNRI